MDINDLTIGQAKELASMFGSQPMGDVYSGLVGKYVIVRSRNEGINAGKVVAADATGIKLNYCRRLWYHKPKEASQSWYEGVANTGVSSDSKLSHPVPEKVIAEAYSATECSEAARTSIEGAKGHECS